ncbi:MAG: shikimate dehydrogenase [Muribaculaceae bacterium]|nr:shikimate dehydrogenase [Muribaculaceae bacterium]
MLKQLSDTDYGLIGRPLGHSKSKEFFTAYFAAQGSKESYDNFELPALTPEALYSLVLLNPQLKGFNVTAPYKVEIMQYLDRISPEAAEAGAVNTVRIVRDSGGRVTALEGYNTDVEGFRQSVLPMTEEMPEGSGALILGTGGAAKAVATALGKLGIRHTFVSRSTSASDTIGYDDITADVIAANPLIINATPLGTYPDAESCPPLPYGLIDSSCFCHDLVYNPATTEFMRRSAERGAKVKNGLEMLHRQAMASLNIWKTK